MIININEIKINGIHKKLYIGAKQANPNNRIKKIVFKTIAINKTVIIEIL